MKTPVFRLLFILSITLSYVSSYITTYYGPIAGNRTISECIRGGISSTSYMDITTTKFIEKFGYPVEEHLVLSEDGYLLTVHRIPGRRGATPVFIQHGLLCSSFDWVVSGKGKSLAFLLADRGYDVWLGNSRGNTYSRCHVKYETTSVQFWNFSWHEMAVYDLPAIFTHITRINNNKIVYIGFSMGTMMSYVMAIERPRIASRLKVIFSLCPVAYVAHTQSVLRVFIPFRPQMEYISKVHGEFTNLAQDSAFKQMMKYTCSGALWQRKLCVQMIFPMVGYNEAQFNYTLLPLIASHYPDGTSWKTVAHSYQLRTSGRFQKYDYGSAENLKIYSNEKPPEYDLTKVRVPVALMYSENDYISHPEDVKKLSQKLPKVILDHKVEHPKFNHIDFLYAIDADKYVYSKILSTIQDLR